LVRSQQDAAHADTVIRTIPSIFFKGQKADPLTAEHGLQALNKLVEGRALDVLTSEEANLVSNLRAAFMNIMPLLKGEDPGMNRHVYRDRQMFNNLMWLIREKYVGQKIIVWAHNAHIARRVVGADGDHGPSMTGHFLGDTTLNPFPYYSLGFTSYNATSVWTNRQVQPVVAQKPPANSFEQWIPSKWDFAFLDWGKWNASGDPNQPFSMKGSLEYSQHRNFVLPWSRFFDGVFFIRDIKGCSTISEQEMRAMAE
jgi:erythromycin esterase-like protein